MRTRRLKIRLRLKKGDINRHKITPSRRVKATISSLSPRRPHKHTLNRMRGQLVKTRRQASSKQKQHNQKSQVVVRIFPYPNEDVGEESHHPKE